MSENFLTLVGGVLIQCGPKQERASKKFFFLMEFSNLFYCGVTQGQMIFLKTMLKQSCGAQLQCLNVINIIEYT